MPSLKHTPQEVESRGESIYAGQIQDKVDPEHQGKFLVIDIETGKYEIDQDDLKATKRLLTRYPNAVIYGLRIGHKAAYRLGGRFGVQER